MILYTRGGISGTTLKENDIMENEKKAAARKKLANRLSRIEGQVRGIKRMLERGEYCMDILVQGAAVEAALAAFNRELLLNHLNTCVREDILAGNDEKLSELPEVMKRIIK